MPGLSLSTARGFVSLARSSTPTFRSSYAAASRFYANAPASSSTSSSSDVPFVPQLASTSTSSQTTANSASALDIPKATDRTTQGALNDPMEDGRESGPSRRATQPYLIPRTANGELPVYSKLRRGNMWKTIIRNVQGDVRDDLNVLLRDLHIDPLRPVPVVTVRPTNQHLEVRGRWVREVKGWMEERGF